MAATVPHLKASDPTSDIVAALLQSGAVIVADMLASDVLFTNSAGVHAEPMADQVLGMMNTVRGIISNAVVLDDYRSQP